MFIVSRKNGIYIGGKRYLPVDAFGEKSGRPWINGPLGGIWILISILTERYLIKENLISQQNNAYITLK